MKRFVWRAAVLVGLLGAGLAAGCGGQGSTASVGDPPGGGIGGTGSVAVVAQGPITAFGSIVVNGIEFELGPGAVVLVDGLETSEGDLQVGMVVRVEGAYDPAAPPTPLGYTPGRAERVEYASEVRGPVESLDPAAGTMTVLGRKVVVLPATVWENGMGLDRLGTGDWVEVSGLVGPGGEIVATYVDAGRAGAVSLRGKIAGLRVEEEAWVFRLGGSTIRAALELSMHLEEGLEVRVDGELSQDGTVQARNITPVEHGGPEGVRMEIEGVVSGVETERRFRVQGVWVDASAMEKPPEGGTWRDIRPGTWVEVEGTFQGGELRATEIEMKREHDLPEHQPPEGGGEAYGEDHEGYED